MWYDCIVDAHMLSLYHVSCLMSGRDGQRQSYGSEEAIDTMDPVLLYVGDVKATRLQGWKRGGLELCQT